MQGGSITIAKETSQKKQKKKKQKNKQTNKRNFATNFRMLNRKEKGKKISPL